MQKEYIKYPAKCPLCKTNINTEPDKEHWIRYCVCRCSYIKAYENVLTYIGFVELFEVYLNNKKQNLRLSFQLDILANNCVSESAFDTYSIIINDEDDDIEIAYKDFYIFNYVGSDFKDKIIDITNKRLKTRLLN